MTDRIKIEMMGVVFGTASGWDQVDDTVIHYYNPVFEKRYAEKIERKYNCVQFDYVSGKVSVMYCDTDTIDSAHETNFMLFCQ
ncbi:MAG: hypothetical protein ABFD07_18035 [Methanobacterium sp.]